MVEPIGQLGSALGLNLLRQLLVAIAWCHIDQRKAASFCALLSQTLFQSKRNRMVCSCLHFSAIGFFNWLRSVSSSRPSFAVYSMNGVLFFQRQRAGFSRRRDWSWISTLECSPTL
ncbi:hypothetical protein M758_9G030500 [Ceratodon purpureus]|nr:hypothetical protein M758_9G030500 [Ceratodon purpureus]